ncbi:MAG: hypothetical protein JO112_07850, partial [Planctomycetes bacterium]|nr:hypothetical protein [Planctomycetota bacterium]
FHIVRKSPDKILALRRIVYDNDHPPQDLEGKGFQRWAGDQDGGSWANDEAHGFHHDTGKGDQLQWLRYRNILRPAPGSTSPPEPELITDFIGYNARRSGLMDYPLLPQNWVGDLILDCEAAIDQPEGNLVLELSKGVDRFQARWDLASGVCTLVRLHDGQEEVLDSKPTALKKKGTYRLRFANVDERLTVWVNKDLPFGPEGTNYGPPTQRGPTRNDLQPASVGVKGAAVGIHQLKLWRDTYYTLDPGASDVDAIESLVRDGASGDLDRRQRLHVILSDPDEWSVFHGLKARTLYVQPNPHHYLCLGDNSPESSDGRSWGLVPERLLLGRALVIYYPFLFPSWPFYSPVNRVGAIR